MEKQTKAGQFAPRQKGIPKPEYPQTSSAQPKAGGTSSPPPSSSGSPKPVKASAVAEETMKRADDYVDGKMTAITNTINEFGKAVKKIPENVPVTMPEDVSKELKDFKKDLAELEKKLDRVKTIKETIDKWLVKGLFFVAGIAAISIIMAGYAGERRVKADNRMKEADAKVQYADSVLKSAESIMKTRETYHDFGRWMVRRYGFQSKDYIEFIDEGIREGKIK